MRLLIRFLLAAFVLAVLPTAEVLAQVPSDDTSASQRNRPPKSKTSQATSPSNSSVVTSTSGYEVITVRGISFKMIVVQGGTFQMGSNDSDANDDEKPVHQVTVSTFSIGETEVTQELWQAVMGSNPSSFKGSKRPVECVSWDDCHEFIRELNSLTGRHFRMPTEAEWQYAARGGLRSSGYKYAGSNNIGAVAWYEDRSDSHTHEVGTEGANELGLYDMSGNVWEWCQDWYGSYSSGSQTNPKGPSSGSLRVLCGGSWFNNAGRCRVSSRFGTSPSGSYCIGLRLVL